MKNKWAVAGLGFISPRHIQAINSIGDEVVMTCDIDPEKGADFLNYTEMVNSKEFKEVTHVAICTPNDTHYRYIWEALDKGKKVLCEKPLVLEEWQTDDMPDDVFTVLQLRYHPDLKKLKKATGPVDMIIHVNRGKSYWSGWKGDEKRSGGILFNLGIHYFDVLIQLFGDEYKVHNSFYTDRHASGIIVFPKNVVNYDLKISDEGDQERSLTVGTTRVNFSSKDNLSYEDLHKKVYSDCKKGIGVSPKDIRRSIELIKRLK